MNTIVCEISILQQLSVSTGSIWKIPLMDDLAVNVNQVDSTRASEVSEERVSWRHIVGVKSSQAKTSAGECTLLHHVRPKSRSVRKLERMSGLYDLKNRTAPRVPSK